VTQPEGTLGVAALIAAPTKGCYRITAAHIGVGEPNASSPPRYFWSH